MDGIPIEQAKEQLDELVARAARGEDVTIVDEKARAFRLTQVAQQDGAERRRQFGHLKGTIPPPPDDFFDPLSEEELEDWYGKDA